MHVLEKIIYLFYKKVFKNESFELTYAFIVQEAVIPYATVQKVISLELLITATNEQT